MESGQAAGITSLRREALPPVPACDSAHAATHRPWDALAGDSIGSGHTERRPIETQVTHHADALTESSWAESLWANLKEPHNVDLSVQPMLGEHRNSPLPTSVQLTDETESPCDNTATTASYNIDRAFDCGIDRDLWSRPDEGSNGGGRLC